MTLLEVDDLAVNFYTEAGVVTAVDRLSYRIERGETLGVVGESGAGKSVAARSLLRLVEGPGRIDGGSIRFHDDDAVAAFEADFPDRVVDLTALREEHDLVELAERLDERGVPGSAVAGPGHGPDATVADLAAADAFDVADLVGRGFAADLGLVDPDDFIVRDGSRRYLEVLRAPEPAVRRLRGNHVAMVFQDAGAALNPVYTVGEQIAEAIRHHLDYDDAEARERAIQLLDRVGVPAAETRYADYPHEFSGGMQQRAVVAMALSCDPDLLICDEPTTGLDVTTEARILDLIEDLAATFDTAVQFITHDMGVVAGICDRVLVLYAGRAVETAPVEELYYDPKHPYTVGLLGAVPRIGDGRERLRTIPGRMPDGVDSPPGCRFHPRCPFAEGICARREPPLLDLDAGDEATVASDRAARCLEYTGDLDEGLDYEVRVRDEDAASESRNDGESTRDGVSRDESAHGGATK